jgi:hypothetical protein
MRRHYTVVMVALLLLVGIAAMAAASTKHHEGEGRCFPAASWDADQGERPCVRVLRVEEDGSFRFRVSDADGTERYVSGVGALDR